MAGRKCNAPHPTLDLKCSEPAGHDDELTGLAHKATDEDGNPHAWVTPSADD